MWSEVPGAVATYMIKYVPVGNTVEGMNTSSSMERTVTAKNSIIITGLNPEELYFLLVQLVQPVNGNSAAVAIGKYKY